MVGALLATALLLLATVYVRRRATLVPGRFQSLMELPIEWLAGVVRSTGGRRWAEFAGLVIAIFLFVLVANMIGLLPGVGVVGITVEGEHGGEETLVPFVRAAAADLNFTLGLAIIAFVAFVAWGIRANGLGGYLKELLIAEPAYMTPLLTPIHLISELSRLISLSMRLFGNVFAGEVLLAVILSLVPLFVPIVFLGLELIFGFVQALVFALLTMTYITLAIAEHRQHESGDEHAGEAPDHSEASPAPGTA
ncbi:MAG: ATP synthase F0 subunit A [Chloroflexi bacterium]|nr:MAG: ATP synthase F0 subunit A [Chloroflexota bacterium]